jgi:hypothetical protein
MLLLIVLILANYRNLSEAKHLRFSSSSDP